MTISEAIKMQDCAFNDGVEAAARYVETNKEFWQAYALDSRIFIVPPDELANEIRKLKRNAVAGVDYLADENDDGRGAA